MYLQSLEILGFKSFAVKTVLEFRQGRHRHRRPQRLRQIQRPRRHALGPRRAIGQGPARRRNGGRHFLRHRFPARRSAWPRSRSGSPIARRSSASIGTRSASPAASSATAHSEYLLNKTPCRLKDIHQLFMDTGIGRSAYSIMEQGKIDQILSSRPEDRRAIFEEAAGITKFKSQKKEALRKLEATEANLLRVTDIIREVKRQIGSLQRQAGKARRYQGMISDLQDARDPPRPPAIRRARPARSRPPARRSSACARRRPPRKPRSRPRRPMSWRAGPGSRNSRPASPRRGRSCRI